jgi:probable phosphoglycerate mutase
MRERHPDGPLLVVGHAGLNRVLLAEYLALPLRDALRIPQPYACLTFLAGW